MNMFLRFTHIHQWFPTLEQDVLKLAIWLVNFSDELDRYDREAKQMRREERLSNN
ncbi:hypothetical protein [Thaumasiovibrio subtropicus]|uniref:hypothetical protein n=1 Tax=Thaumasiovibrio subtropicus TaxID=1891207 RepID=UPI00131DCC20|nr:hypothetical protein [Thaumasiovibrio subtropicus]